MEHDLTYDTDTHRISFTLGADAVVGFEAVRLASDLDTIPEAILSFLHRSPLQVLAAASLLASPMMHPHIFDEVGDFLTYLADAMYSDPLDHKEAYERANLAFEAALANLSMWEAE